MKLYIIPNLFIAMALITASDVQANPLPLSPVFSNGGIVGSQGVWQLADMMVKCLLKAHSEHKTNDASASLLDKYYTMKGHPDNTPTVLRTLSELDAIKINVYDDNGAQKPPQGGEAFGHVVIKQDGGVPPGIYLSKQLTNPAASGYSEIGLAAIILNLSVIYTSKGRSTNTLLVSRTSAHFVDSNTVADMTRSEKLGKDQHLVHMEWRESNMEAWKAVREHFPQLLPGVPDATAAAGYECITKKPPSLSLPPNKWQK